MHFLRELFTGFEFQRNGATTTKGQTHGRYFFKRYFHSHEHKHSSHLLLFFRPFFFYFEREFSEHCERFEFSKIKCTFDARQSGKTLCIEFQ